MKRIALAFIAILLAFTMTACTTLDGLMPNLGPHVKIKNISLLNGITLSIKDVDCTFSFTTDRDIILSEVKRCLIGDGEMRGLVMSAPPIMNENGEYETDPIPEPVLDSETEKEAERIAEDIIKAIESAQ